MLSINNPEPVCEPATVDLTDATIISGSTEGLVYTYFTDDLALQAVADPTAVAGGIYYIKGTETATECFDIQPVTITVYNQIGSNYPTNYINGTVCAKVNENGTAVLTAPAGAVFISVDFASYGNPTGSCPDFIMGSCHAATSQTVVEGYLLGKNSAAIPAKNTIFGDPCSGTAKRLYIKATYSNTGTVPDPICAGTASGTITGSLPTGGSGTYVYLWESSVTSATDGFAPAAGINDAQDYSPGALDQTTWFRRTVTSACATSISQAAMVKVNELLVPDVQIDAPSEVIAGTQITLTAIPVNEGTSPTYQWYNYTTVIGNSSELTYLPADGDEITVEMTSSETCLAANPVTSNPINITVNPAVSVLITDPAAVCAPATVDLSDPAITDGSTQGVDYTYWEDAEATIPYSSYLTATNGTYYIKGTMPATGVFDIQPVTVTVYNQIGNNYPTNYINGTVCATVNENGTAVLTAPAGAVFISVDFASYGNPTGSCPDFIMGSCHAATSQTVVEGYLLGKNSAAIPAKNTIFGDPCSGTAKRLYIKATYSNTGTVPDPICAGTASGTITGSLPTGGSGTYVYLWESSVTSATDGFAPAAGINDAQDYSPGALDQTTWFRRTVTSTCATSISQAAMVKVNELLVPDVQIDAPSEVIAGTQITLTAIPVNEGTSPTYQWYNYTTVIGNSSELTYLPADGDEITVEMTSSETCLAANPVTSNPINITVNPAVSVLITDPAAVCAPATVDLSDPAITDGSTQGVDYTYWEDAEATIPYSSYLTATNGTYYIKGTMPATGVFDIQPVTVTVYSQIGNNYPTNYINGTVCATVNENGTAVLTAPAGAVFISVDFASYGNPTGSCPDFIMGSCHAATSQTVVEGYLLGKNSAAIPAKNTIFGDPCSGTAKRLYIKATYSNTGTVPDPICAGTASGTITGSLPTGGSGTYVYLWESSVTSATDGFAPAAGINDAQDYSPGALDQTTWFRRTVTSECLRNTSEVAQITVVDCPAALVSALSAPKSAEIVSPFIDVSAN